MDAIDKLLRNGYKEDPNGYKLFEEYGINTMYGDKPLYYALSNSMYTRYFPALKEYAKTDPVFLEYAKQGIMGKFYSSEFVCHTSPNYEGILRDGVIKRGSEIDKDIEIPEELIGKNIEWPKFHENGWHDFYAHEYDGYQFPGVYMSFEAIDLSESYGRKSEPLMHFYFKLSDLEEKFPLICYSYYEFAVDGDIPIELVHHISKHIP